MAVLTPQEFEDGANSILDNTPKKGVGGSEGITKVIFKAIIRQFRMLYEGIKEVYNDAFQWQGTWTNSKLYKKGDVVTSGGSMYRAIFDNTGVAVTNAATWELVVQRGATGPQGVQGPVGPASTVPGPQGPVGPTGNGHTQILTGDGDPPASISSSTALKDLYIDRVSGNLFQRVAALVVGWTPFVVNPTNVYWQGIAKLNGRNTTYVNGYLGFAQNFNTEYSLLEDSPHNGGHISFVFEGIAMPNNQPFRVVVAGFVEDGTFVASAWSAVAEGDLMAIVKLYNVNDKLSIRVEFPSTVTRWQGEWSCNLQGNDENQSESLKVTNTGSAATGTLLATLAVTQPNRLCTTGNTSTFAWFVTNLEQTPASPYFFYIEYTNVVLGDSAGVGAKMHKGYIFCKNAAGTLSIHIAKCEGIVTGNPNIFFKDGVVQFKIETPAGGSNFFPIVSICKVEASGLVKNRVVSVNTNGYSTSGETGRKTPTFTEWSQI